MKKNHVYLLTSMAMLVALEVVLSRFCSIATPIVKIGFSFAPVALMGMLFGPFWAAIGAGAADMIGATLFPIGAYFPGFTLTAMLIGATYGLLLHGEQCGWPRVLLAVAITTLAWNLLLNTLWLVFTSGTGYLALLPVRVTKCLLMAPIEAVVIRCIGHRRVLQALAHGAQVSHS